MASSVEIVEVVAQTQHLAVGERVIRLNELRSAEVAKLRKNVEGSDGVMIVSRIVEIDEAIKSISSPSSHHPEPDKGNQEISAKEGVTTTEREDHGLVNALSNLAIVNEYDDKEIEKTLDCSTHNMLPEGWVKRFSKSKQKFYFFHKKSGASQWHLPSLTLSKPTNTKTRDISVPRKVLTSSSVNTKRVSLEDTKSCDDDSSQRSLTTKARGKPPTQRTCSTGTKKEPRSIEYGRVLTRKEQVLGYKRDEAAHQKHSRAVVMLDNDNLPANTVKSKSINSTRSQTMGIMRNVFRRKDIGEEVIKITSICGEPPKEAKISKYLQTAPKPHQAEAIAWCAWRELPDQIVRGGMLADDMGLGKTLSMLAVIAAAWERGESKPTLVVCPASLIQNWINEIDIHLDSDEVQSIVYHGPKKSDVDLESISARTIFVTTYQTIAIDSKKEKTDASSKTLCSVSWARIVLDEGHLIRNSKAKISIACCSLLSDSRWIVTGSPMNNNLDEVYAMIGRFLKCGSFADESKWKDLITNKKHPALGRARLTMLLDVLIMRRMKDDKKPDGNPLVELPERSFVEHKVSLSVKEKNIYRQIYNKTRSHVFRIKSSVKSKKSSPSVLTSMLKLRQLCCHFALVSESEADSVDNAKDDSGADELTEALNKLTIECSSEDHEVASSKLDVVMSTLRPLLANSAKEGGDNKVVIISQWTGLLSIVEQQLIDEEIRCLRLDGSTSINERQDIVDSFNSTDTPVLLLSLMAGGVGLNLTSANHCFMLDLPYNPSSFDQACDRIFRMGQTRAVSVHTFICCKSIEEWQLKVLMRKRRLAKSVLPDTSSLSRASEEEILDLFKAEFQ